MLEPDGAAILRIEPVLAVCEAAYLAARALAVVGAVEEGNVLVTDVAEPGLVLANADRIFLINSRAGLRP